MSSRFGAVARLVLIDLAGSVLWFPYWWYTTGLIAILQATKNALIYRSRSFGIKIWIRNFFVPMYGQYDWTGRLVSVFMRFVVLIGRCIFMGFEALIYVAGIALWIAAPPLFLFLAVMSFIQGAFVDQVRGVIR